jgi:CheY-like chemotaxis protein
MSHLLNILLVDDDLADAMLFQEAARVSGFEYSVHHAFDGSEAIDYLETSGNQVDLIVTDWNMPIMNGKSLVETMRARQDLNKFPVVVMSTGISEDDTSYCKSQGVLQCYRKPVDFDEYQCIVNNIIDLWGTIMLGMIGRA